MGIPELDTNTLKVAVYLADWMHPHDLPFFIPPDSFSPRFGTQFFTVQCTGWEMTQKESDNNQYVVYIFKIRRGRQENVVRIRYSEMLSFRAELISIPVIGGDCVELIEFPAKSYAPWNWFRAKALDDRVDGFNTFLTAVFRINLLYPGLKCVRHLFGFDEFDTCEWWKETGYGAIRKNTFNTPRIVRRHVSADADGFQVKRRRSAGVV